MVLRSIIAIIPSFLLLACSTFNQPQISQESQTKARAFFEAGVSLFSEERYPESLRAFDEATKIHPKNPSYEMHKALALFYVGRREQGVKHILKSCSLTSEFPECHNNSSLLLLELDRPEEALEAAQKALAVKTFRSPERALKNAGRAYYKLGRPEEAEKSYREALSKPGAQRYCDIRLLHSQSLLALTQFKPALKEAQITQKLCENEPKTHFWLAYVQYRTAQMSESQETLEHISRYFRDPQVRSQAQDMLRQLILEEALAEPNILL